jgi:hypothetical protein
MQVTGSDWHDEGVASRQTETSEQRLTKREQTANSHATDLFALDADGAGCSSILMVPRRADARSFTTSNFGLAIACRRRDRGRRRR